MHFEHKKLSMTKLGLVQGVDEVYNIYSTPTPFFSWVGRIIPSILITNTQNILAFPVTRSLHGFGQ